MRIHEIVLAHLGDGGRIVPQGTAGDLLLRSALPAGVEVSETGAAARDEDVVLAELADVATLGQLLAELRSPASVVLVSGSDPAVLPVGAILDAVLSEGYQLLEAWPVVHGNVRAALVLRRADGVIRPTPYLAAGGGSTGTTLNRRAHYEQAQEPELRRIVGEWVLDGFVSRARERQLESAVETAAAEAALSRAPSGDVDLELRQTRAELAAERAQHGRLRRSRTVRLALATRRVLPGGRRGAR